nr:MAG TPA: hypothetical protein [Caudoviricetes sp.]
MLGLWSKGLITSNDKAGNGYLIFMDNSGAKLAATESYVLYTRDFRSYKVTKLESNASYLASTVLNGQTLVWMHTYKGSYTDSYLSQSKYEDVIYKVNDDLNFETVLSGRIAEENSVVADLNNNVSGFASNGKLCIGSERYRTGGKAYSSSDFINWSLLSGHSSDQVSTPLYKDGVFYVVSGTGDSNCVVMRSHDGISWSKSNVLGYREAGFTKHLGACDSFFIITAGAYTEGDSTTRCSVSSDGVQWVDRNLPISMAAYPIAGKDFVLLHENDTSNFVKVTDLDSFSVVSPTFDGEPYNSIVDTNVDHVFISIDGGERIISIPYAGGKVYESSDGVTFTSIGEIPLSLKPGESIDLAGVCKGILEL